MITEQYVWFVWSLMFLIPWVLLYALYPVHRKGMLWTSLFTMPFGLTEPLFVPEYWSPPSLFNLALTTGFDIESFIFCFGIGGVGVVLYNVITGARFEPVSETYRRSLLHSHHKLAVAAPFIAFPLFYFLPWNPIYPAIAAMITGTIATILCRPDLKNKTWTGGIIFTLYYWLFIKGLELLSPGYIELVWNLGALSGAIVFDIPLEELLFAFTFGMYWAGVYEHFTWKKSGS
jgi:hypothetical protein